MRDGNVTGRLNAPLPALAVPLPSITEPAQSTSTLRSNVMSRLRGVEILADLKVSTTPRSADLRGPRYFFVFAVSASCTAVPATPSATQASSVHLDSVGIVGYRIHTFALPERPPRIVIRPTITVHAPPNAVLMTIT